MLGLADELTHAAIRANTAMYDGLWDAMYVLLLLGFAIGNLGFGLEVARGPGVTRVVSYFIIAGTVHARTNATEAMVMNVPTTPTTWWSLEESLRLLFL